MRSTTSLKLSFTCMLWLNIFVLFSKIQTKRGKKLEQFVFCFVLFLNLVALTFR